jgi:hypothetical protein
MMLPSKMSVISMTSPKVEPCVEKVITNQHMGKEIASDGKIIHDKINCNNQKQDIPNKPGKKRSLAS